MCACVCVSLVPWPRGRRETCLMPVCVCDFVFQEDALAEPIHKLKEGEELALVLGPRPSLQVTKMKRWARVWE